MIKTIEIDDTLAEHAAQLTGVKDTERLVNLALSYLVAKEAAAKPDSPKPQAKPASPKRQTTPKKSTRAK